MIAGFASVDGGVTYDCSLQPDQIVEELDLEGQNIPLMAPMLWHTYYARMHRTSKVQMIERALGLSQ